MKSLFSVMVACCLNTNAVAKPIVLLTFNDAKEKAIQTRKILIENLNIPEFLIEEKKSTTPCEPQPSLLQICVDDKENVVVVKNAETTGTHKALAIFVKGNQESLKEIQNETGTDKTVPDLKKDEIE